MTMTLNYEVGDVVRVLIKRWYILVGVMILCAALAIPSSRASYDAAAATYAERTNYDKLYVEQLAALENERMNTGNMSEDDAALAARAAAMTEQALAFNKMILKEPTVRQSAVKSAVTAAAFGLPLACIIAFILDYQLMARKIKRTAAAQVE